jgi:hypothetical protein
MPFQVTYSILPNALSPVTLVSAGADQTHICTPVIYLEADVEGNMIGHTIEWEQIKGTAVTLQDADTLNPYFVAVDTTDKAFRLWIDKNTPNVQTGVINIFKTPISKNICSFTPLNFELNVGVNLQPVACDDILGTLRVIVPPPTSVEGEETSYILELDVEWSHPGETADIFINQYRIYKNSALVASLPTSPLPITSEGGGPPTDQLLYTDELATYRVDAHYSVGGQEYVIQSCEKDLTTTTVPNVKAYNDSIRNIAYSPSNHGFNQTNYGFIVQQLDDSQTHGFNPTTSDFSLQTYINTVLTEATDTDQTVAFSYDNHLINITRYDPSGIGSG